MWLMDIAIFFVCLHKESLPSQKLFDEWITKIWRSKLGIQVSFFRMVQKGIFVVFFKSHGI